MVTAKLQYDALYHVCYQLHRFGVLGAYHGAAHFALQFFSRVAGDAAAALGYGQVFGHTLGLFGLGDAGRAGLGEHVEHQLQVAHVVAQVLLFQPLVALVLPRGHARPGLAYLVGQYRVLAALLHAAPLPLVGQLVAYPYRERTNFAKEISALLRETYGSKIKVFTSEIPHSVRAKEISAEGKSIYAHDPNGKVAEGYKNLTKEVLKLEKQREKNRAGLSR